MKGAIRGTPLPLGESVAIVWPQLTALATVCH
jgi:hypothetical protein